MDHICLSFEHENNSSMLMDDKLSSVSWAWLCSHTFLKFNDFFPDCERACECIHVEEEVTFKPAHNNQPSPHSLIIPVCNQASMAESTPTAYTPNTLTGNLFSPRAFVCSFEGQPANRGRGSSAERQTEHEKMLRYKGTGRQRRQRAVKRGRRENRTKRRLSYTFYTAAIWWLH